MDEFEDFASDNEFSDVDGGEEWSDDESARVVGLLEDAASRSNQPANVVDCEDLEVNLPKDLQMREREPTEPAVNDFELFLAEFSRQQVSGGVCVAEPTPSVCELQPTCQHTTNQSTPREPEPTSSSLHTNANKRWCPVESADGDVSKLHEHSQPKWGVFLPERMPVRREPTTIKSSVLKTESQEKLQVLVPRVAYYRSRKPRHSSSTKQEPSYHPTVNKAYYRRRGIARLRCPMKVRFAKRMQLDIADREARRQKRVAQKERQEYEDVVQHRSRRNSLIAKGSQEILERNGLWEEPLDVRLNRLLQIPSRHRARTDKNDKSVRRMLREKELAKDRACESLYRRGLDKIKRDRENKLKTRQEPQEMLSRSRSNAIVREKMEKDLRILCSPDSASEKYPTSSSLPPTVSFVEFSCVLLYFGFVPDANTVWEENPAVTLLWYAWTVFASGDGEQRVLDTRLLKQLVECVILNGVSTDGAHRQRPSTNSKIRLQEIFRVNYLARAHPRTSTPRSCQLKRPSKSFSSKPPLSGAVYSLHGKVKRVCSEGDTEDPLELRHTATQRRVEQLRLEKENREIAECTFKPRVSLPGCYSLFLGETAEQSDSSCSSAELEPFNRLYADAFVRKRNNVSMCRSARQADEEQRMKEMRISPTYVNGMTIEERLQRLQEAMSNNALPVHFYEKIAQMRRAHDLKIQEAQDKKRRLETVQVFPKTRDGHTIVAPFSFASRTSKPSLRQTTKTCTGTVNQRLSCPTARLLRQMKQRYDPPNEEASRPEDHFTDLCIDVHLSPFETYQLRLNCGDDVQSTIEVFANKHNLDDNQTKNLLHHAQTKLKEFFDL